MRKRARALALAKGAAKCVYHAQRTATSHEAAWNKVLEAEKEACGPVAVLDLWAIARLNGDGHGGVATVTHARVPVLIGILLPIALSTGGLRLGDDWLCLDDDWLCHGCSLPRSTNGRVRSVALHSA